MSFKLGTCVQQRWRRLRGSATTGITVYVFPEDGAEFALLDLGGKRGSALRQQLEQGLLKTGRPLPSGGPVGHACLPFIGAGVFTGVVTSLSDGNFFVATASPATLMGIHGGLGSAIMGPAGIVGHAPFVPAAGAIMPVVAPVLLLATLSSITMAIRLDRIEKTLAGVAKRVDYLLDNQVAEDAARVLSASERLSDLREEYSRGPGFTNEMKMRLALIERDISVLRHKHDFLARRSVGFWAQNGKVLDLGPDCVAEAKPSKNDQELFVASSTADLQVGRLRFLLALQDNPTDAPRRYSALHKRVQEYENDFRSLAEQNDKLKARLRKSLDEMNWWSRRVRRKDKAIKETLSEVENKTGLDRPNGSADAEHCSILFWRDNDGAGRPKAWWIEDSALAKLCGCPEPTGGVPA